MNTDLTRSIEQATTIDELVSQFKALLAVDISDTPTFHPKIKQLCATTQVLAVSVTLPTNTTRLNGWLARLGMQFVPMALMAVAYLNQVRAWAYLAKPNLKAHWLHP